MQQTRNESELAQTDDQPTFQNYMPGMPQLSSEPGRIERFLKRLFRRRGEFRARVRRE